MKFGGRLKQLRESRSLSQEQLAINLDIPRTSINHYENSDEQVRLPRHDRLNKIADFFNVTVDYLLGRADNNESNTDWKERAVNAEARNVQLELELKTCIELNESPSK